MNTDKCKNCLNSRAIISENGTHYNCTLSPKQAIECITGKKVQEILLSQWLYSDLDEIIDMNGEISYE